MSSSSDGSWSTKAYTQKLSFVCEKPVGGKKNLTIEVHEFTIKSIGEIMKQSCQQQWAKTQFEWLDKKLLFVISDFCLFDMVEHGGQCYDFIIDPNVNNVAWSITRDACANAGLDMITEGGHGFDNWITKYLYNTGIFSYPNSVNGMWIGYYGNYLSNTYKFLFSSN